MYFEKIPLGPLRISEKKSGAHFNMKKNTIQQGYCRFCIQFIMFGEHFVEIIWGPTSGFSFFGGPLYESKKYFRGPLTFHLRPYS